MSGGNNHYPRCTCPWCYHPSYAVSYDAEPIKFRSATRDSYNNPNARCPECDAPVFFYRSPYGGSVYFDELGVPWPKHPCMDKGRPPRRYNRSVESDDKTTRQAPKWQREGWLPIAFYVIGKPDPKGIQSVFAKEVLNGFSHNWKTSNMPDAVKDGPAFARKNSDGKWEIETPSGKFIATEYKIDPSKLPLWRQRMLFRRLAPGKSQAKPITEKL